MKNTSKIQFYARESKKDKNGLVHIEMSVNINQKRVFINLPMQVEPKKFNSKRQPKDEFISPYNRETDWFQEITTQSFGETHLLHIVIKQGNKIGSGFKSRWSQKHKNYTKILRSFA